MLSYQLAPPHRLFWLSPRTTHGAAALVTLCLFLYYFEPTVGVTVVFVFVDFVGALNQSLSVRSSSHRLSTPPPATISIPLCLSSVIQNDVVLSSP